MSKLDLIKTDYGPCNINCVFCRLHKSPPPSRSSKQEILSQIRACKDAGVEHIRITSGEPTLDPNFLDYIRFAKELKITTVLVETNGIKLAEDEFIEKIAKLGQVTFLINTPSHKKEIYEKITQTPGSFENHKKSLENLAKHNFKFIANIALINLNYKFEDVKGLIEFLKETGLEVNHITLRPLRVNLKGSGEDIYLAEYAALGREIGKIIKYCKNQNILVQGMPAFSIPLCACQGFEKFFAEDPKDKWEQMNQFFFKLNICKKCKIEKYCPGVLKFYNKKFRPTPYTEIPETLKV
ncbi:MAG: radical SAM protein [Candidatus Altiarchaeota archaeon]|nr:radical SAM protein [Candidatus Altiarchaeota archaeon]